MKTLKEKANKLPLNPGVYIMKDSKGNIIYIGKAKALKNRVSQYFGSQNKHPQKVRKMVESVRDFDYILTDSEFEALVLECSLIKKHMPKYNILLRDDKGFSYIKVTKGEWRNIYAVLQRDDENAEYIGPYTAGYTVTKAVEEAKRIFKLPVCNKTFSGDFKKTRPCLNYHIGICSAPCGGHIRKADYDKNVENAIDFLKNGSRKVIEDLTAEMLEASENLEFEKAAKIRDTIKSIEKLNSSQKVFSSVHREQDVFAIHIIEGKGCLSVFRFRENNLTDSEHFFFDEQGEAPAMRAELIAAYYSMDRKIPVRIEVDGEVEGAETLEKWLSEKRCGSVSIVVPQRGEQARLVNMCRNNAAQKLSEKYLGKDKGREALEELALLLGLKNVPEYIEAYDISHTGGSDNVAGMVVFKGGKPLKSAYRRFAVKGFAGQDDYGSMTEVVSRRLEEYFKHKDDESVDNSQGFGHLPDLILLDGGKGQVNAVLPVMEKYGLNIPVFGMVKNNKHKTSAISTGGGRIEFNSRKRAFSLVTEIQDEVHRFAVTYHRKKHTKSAFGASLTEIRGIGEKKAKALIAEFKTMDAIRKADAERLVKVKGISQADALEIIKSLRGE